VRVAPADSARSWFSVRLPCSQLLVDVRHPSIVVAGPQPGRDFGHVALGHVQIPARVDGRCRACDPLRHGQHEAGAARNPLHPGRAA
jgi:hypothetical protein